MLHQILQGTAVIGPQTYLPPTKPSMLSFTSMGRTTLTASFSPWPWPMECRCARRRTERSQAQSCERRISRTVACASHNPQPFMACVQLMWKSHFLIFFAGFSQWGIRKKLKNPLVHHHLPHPGIFFYRINLPFSGTPK